MARTNYTTDDLIKLGLVKDKDGNWHKPKTVQQPREMNGNKSLLQMIAPIQIEYNKTISKIESILASTPKPIKAEEPKIKRKLTLNLFGEPMPKQSVRGYATGRRNEKGTLVVDHFQPKKTTDRKADYIRQIKQQLPEGFEPFMTEVFVTKFHCIYPPLKGFHKIKGRMEAIREGQIFYKNTQPDLIDNLKKLIFDCLGKDKKTKIPLVLGNDGIIVGEDNTRKYYGSGGAIILELEGY